MAPRSSPASAAPESIDGKLDAFLAEVKSRFDQHGESVGELAEAVREMVEEVRTLRVAIDDIRAELEWTMRNHAPRREPATGLPVKSLPKPPAAPEQCEADATRPAGAGRLF